MKEQLVFDTSDATSIAHSDSVGAYVRSSDGTLITHTTNGPKEALDVNIAASDIQLEVDLDHTEDSVRLGDGTSFFTSTSENGDIALDVHISNSNIEVTQGTSPWVVGDGGGSLTVDAVDLDIRDLDSASDSVEVFQATHDNLNLNANLQVGDADVANGNPVPVSDAGGSITVDAVDFDIRDLTAVSDSVASHLFDGAGTALTSTLVGADQALDVNLVQAVDPATANTAIASAANTLAAADTAQDVVASPLANRKYLNILNADNKRIYVGASGVTAANGYPISPRGSMMLRLGSAVDIEFVGSSGETPQIRTLELS